MCFYVMGQGYGSGHRACVVGFFWGLSGCLVGFVLEFDDFGFFCVDSVPDYFVAQGLNDRGQVYLFCFGDFCGFS